MENKNKRPSWDEYFMKIAEVVSTRATCLRRKYGAIIVDDKKIISTGYNGSPKGMKNCIDLGYCEREKQNVPSGERYELCEAVHAEQNAMINGNPERMKQATIYVAGFETDGDYANSKPCKLCERMIKNAEIGEVVYRTSSGAIEKKIA